MSLPRPDLRSAWITLAVLLAALAGPRGASASCVAMRDSGACPRACGCCEAPAPEGQVPDAPSTAAARPAPADALCCVCRPQTPVAPDPTSGSRLTRPAPERVRDLGVVRFRFDTAPEPGLVAPLSPAAPRPKLPTYLRTSRLLI